MQTSNITTAITFSSGVMSQRQICPSWQPVMMVLKSSITRRLLMQCVGAVRPHSTMGRTRLFPDMMLMCLQQNEVTELDLMTAFNHAASNCVGQGAKRSSAYTVGCKLGLTCRMINRKGDIFDVSTLFFLQTESNTANLTEMRHLHSV